MTAVAPLPLPQLGQKTINAITILTDDALASSVGVYAGFTLRQGGVSSAPYDSLNLATHVQDDGPSVLQNRFLLEEALGFPDVPLVVPNQVHGTTILTVEGESDDQWQDAVKNAAEGADSIIINASQRMTILNFADCLPAIIVSPTGRFAVVHAGWRGALAGIVGKALRKMQQQDTAAGYECDASWYNLYIGPHIQEECFEVSAEIAQQFAMAYGSAVLRDDRHVSLSRAVQTDAAAAGMNSQRMIDARLCTVCHHDQVFSYRASGGVCGRHGAFGVRR